MSLRESSPYIIPSTAAPPAAFSLAQAPASASTPTPAKKNRCPCCQKRLALTDYDCRCGQRYCSTHRLPESHECQYDFRAANKALLSTQLTRVVGDKLERV